jgi:hypothetical protein
MFRWAAHHRQGHKSMSCVLTKLLLEFNVFHVHALYYTKILITNECTKRVLSSIVTHSRSRPALQKQCRLGPQRVHASKNNAVHSQQHILTQL